MNQNPKAVPKAKILVLDDEEEIVSVFSMLMEQFGYQAEFFSNGLEALEAVERAPTRFDLIVTDIRMPQMDGLTLARRIRAVRPDIPIIFMTGYPSDEIKRKTRELGKTVFLEKPFHLQKTFEDLIPKLLA